jgi:hypothetical protein
MRIRIIEAPARVRSGEEFAVRVEFENRTPWRLGTFPPLPLYFTYRWLSGPARNAAAGALLTPLSFPVEPGSKGIYYVRVAAPAAQGNFRLRLTFVQEGFRRFDSLFPRVCADVRIEVQ